MDGQANVCRDRASVYLRAQSGNSFSCEIIGSRILGEGVWAMCSGMLRAARSSSGTEGPLSAQVTLGPSDSSCFWRRALSWTEAWGSKQGDWLGAPGDGAARM